MYMFIYKIYPTIKSHENITIIQKSLRCDTRNILINTVLILKLAPIYTKILTPHDLIKINSPRTKYRFTPHSVLTPH